jgi:predicted nucleotidyltransferase
MDTQFYLDRIVELFKEEMVGHLTGIYVHGSLAMGCFNPNISDIDFLVITKGKLQTDTYKRISKKLLSLHAELPNKGGIEMSIILEACLEDLAYPTPFEFHYSAFHRERYQNDENYMCGGSVDTDLVAHLFVTYHRGIALYGKPIQEVFKPIGRPLFIQSILCDLAAAPQGIKESPVYYILNLCRFLCFLKEGIVASKKEGGEWGLTVVPIEYQDLIRQSLEAYSDATATMQLDNQRLAAFAEHMLSEIKLLIDIDSPLNCPN